MYNPSFVAAALAAAVISVAVSTPGMAKSSGPANISADSMKESKASSGADCRYLLGCPDKASSRAGDDKPAKKATKAGGHKKKVHKTKTAKTASVKRRQSRSAAKAADVDPIRTASTATAGAAAANRYSAIVARYAADYDVPVSLAHAVIQVESNYRPDITGSAGEVGLMQIKPSTARMLGYRGSAKGLYDPETNIRYGMKYLAMARDVGDGTTCGTILKYNAGHAARRMNPVSSAYCRKVKVEMASAGDPA
jgi:soluble lytic murein transglycosylase-like protein